MALCHPELVEGLSLACPELSLPWACRREGKGRRPLFTKKPNQ